jgi:hypothetical protein
VVAIIKHFKLEDVCRASSTVNVSGMTIMKVKGLRAPEGPFRGDLVACEGGRLTRLDFSPEIRKRVAHHDLSGILQCVQHLQGWGIRAIFQPLSAISRIGSRGLARKITLAPAPALALHTAPLKVANERSLGATQFVRIEIEGNHAEFEKASVI